MNNPPYVFVSYAHHDEKLVIPCLNVMQNSGINLWYDNGVQAGSEWPEFIAEKVAMCSKFVLFVSNAYLLSQNCKRELNFAISRKKDILTIYIEDVNLTPGMEMQLGTYQAVFMNRFNNVSEFQNSLCNEQCFDICKSTERQPNEPGVQPPTPPKPTLKNNGNSIYDKGYKTTLPQVNLYKNRNLAIILAMLGGSFGLHKFYLKKNVSGLIYLIFCWTYIPFILGIIDGIFLLTASEAKLEQKYNYKFK